MKKKIIKLVESFKRWFGINVLRIPETLMYITQQPVDLKVLTIECSVNEQESRSKFDAALGQTLAHAVSELVARVPEYAMVKELVEKRSGWNRHYRVQIVVAVPKQKKGAQDNATNRAN